MKFATLVYSPEAKEYLRHLHPSIKIGLREMIEELATNPFNGKPLQEEFEGFRSYRFKKYRVIYRYLEKKNCIEILFAGPRPEIYQLFGEYLKKLSY